MAKFKVVSQKRLIKGLNAGTGILTQPPSTITRVSNLFFNQRGSLQTTNGSGIVGQLNAPNTTGLAFGAFANLSSGQYPYYPAITSGDTYSLPNTQLGDTPAIFSGSSSNPFGSYAFTIVSIEGGLHSDPVASIFSASPSLVGHSFSVINFSWIATPGATSYQVWYFPGGAGSTSGVLLGSPSTNSFTFSGTLPTTPLTSPAAGNNSFIYTLQIGNIIPPSKQVFFSTTAATFPGVMPEPAQLSPGDPNFQFQMGSTTVTDYSGGVASGSVTQSNSDGTSSSSTGATGGFPSTSLPSGTSVPFSVVIEGSISASVGSLIAASGEIDLQVSTDGGSTWSTIFTFSATGSETLSPTTVTGSTTALTNLDNLTFQALVSATLSGGAIAGDTVSVTATIDSTNATTSVSSSFTPYGGIIGYCDPIPQVLQFDQLAILILGNGYAPQSCNPALLASATATALTNTFQATYPAWQANVSWIQGDNIAVPIGGTNYVFSAIQGGTSGGAEPTFPTTLGATVSDGQVVWKNTGKLTTSIAPRGAAHGIVYAGSLWLYNTSPETTSDQLDGPTCLKMSDSDNPNSWNPVNIAFLGKDDGTQGTGMATFTIAEVGIAPTGSLVCFKEFSTYQVLGVFGATDFQIVQAQTDLGCIAARTIQFLAGYGIVRLTHMGFAIFDGVKDKLISEEIRPYLYGGIQLNADIVGLDFSYVYLSYAVQSSVPPMYVCLAPLSGANGSLSRMFVYDLVLKAWTILNLPWSVTTLLQARTGEGNPLTLGFRGDGTGILERFFAGDASWDAASLVPSIPAAQTAITWSFQTVYVYDEGSSARVFYREVVIRGYGNAGPITVTIQSDGNPAQTYQTYIEPQPFSGQFEASVDLMFTAQIVNIGVQGTGVVTIDGLDWKVSPKPGGRIMIG